MKFDNEQKAMINELQKLAEEVFKLKQEHRQKRPIVIEFSGSPKAGKTSCINSLELFLKRNGFSVEIIQERASVCPVSDKQSPMFNLWTVCMSLAGMIGTLEDKKKQVDVLILDRGVFDALCWFEWLVSNSKMEEYQRKVTEQFLLMNDLINNIDIVFAFCTKPDISIEREFATLLTNKMGSIMNEKVLGEYLKAIENTIKDKSEYFHKVFMIETSNKNQNEVGKEVTINTLNTLKDLLMERIGYFEVDKDLREFLCMKSVIGHNELGNRLSSIKFDLREIVENNVNLLQPIPIAVITNKEQNKILTIKKKKSAMSKDSPEWEKLLLYVGGHSRQEDITEAMSKDFISVCRATLKREIKEEIGISVALNDVIPIYIYTPTSERSMQHLAVCFLISLDIEGIKLHLDPQELVLNKGTSKSGKFCSLEELKTEVELEGWSKTILKYILSNGKGYNEQLSMFKFLG